MSREQRKSSPYYKTPLVGDYRDLLKLPTVPQSENDEYYTIENKFDRRPDLLANALYGSTRLWWIFTKRNMNLIQDPINDFRAGKTIRIPQKSSVANLIA
jgi:hypothetical protein|tara:strand:+ start:494 stop:793 length:300 start_codon:yes stop_codon:yes gene_type:complete